MASYHRSMALLQENADIVAKLASSRRSIHLLFCQRCYQAGGMHGRAIYTAVEALSFLGVPWGFINSDGDGDGLHAKLESLPRGDVLLLPDVTHSDPAMIAAIEHWITQRGASATLIVSPPPPAPPPLSFDAASGFRHATDLQQRALSMLREVPTTRLREVRLLVARASEASAESAANHSRLMFSTAQHVQLVHKSGGANVEAT